MVVQPVQVLLLAIPVQKQDREVMQPVLPEVAVHLWVPARIARLVVPTVRQRVAAARIQLQGRAVPTTILMERPGKQRRATLVITTMPAPAQEILPITAELAAAIQVLPILRRHNRARHRLLQELVPPIMEMQEPVLPVLQALLEQLRPVRLHAKCPIRIQTIRLQAHQVVPIHLVPRIHLPPVRVQVQVPAQAPVQAVLAVAAAEAVVHLVEDADNL